MCSRLAVSNTNYQFRDQSTLRIKLRPRRARDIQLALLADSTTSHQCHVTIDFAIIIRSGRVCVSMSPVTIRYSNRIRTNDLSRMSRVSRLSTRVCLETRYRMSVDVIANQRIYDAHF